MKIIINTETNEITEAELTAEEIAEREANEARALLEEQEANAKAQQRAALLERLGITEEEAALLLS